MSMNITRATHTITVNSGGKIISQFKVPALNWIQMVNFTKQNCKDSKISAMITVESDRDGIIYTSVVK